MLCSFLCCNELKSDTHTDTDTHTHTNIPGGTAVKNSSANAGRHGFDPWVGKILCSRKRQPTAVFLPGKLHGQSSLAGYSTRGHKESDNSEHTPTPSSLSWTFLPAPPESHPSRSPQSTALRPLRFIAASHCLLHSRWCLYVNAPVSVHPPLLPLCPQVHSLCPYLDSCPANIFIGTIFLDSLCMH